MDASSSPSNEFTRELTAYHALHLVLQPSTAYLPTPLNPRSRAKWRAPAATELSSEALGGKAVDVSDEFFCAAQNLLKVPVRPRSPRVPETCSVCSVRFQAEAELTCLHEPAALGQHEGPVWAERSAL